MLEQYQRYMERRTELIKAGKGLSEATNMAFEEVYERKIKPETIDILSPANS